MIAKRLLLFALALLLTASCAPRRHHHFRCSDEELKNIDEVTLAVHSINQATDCFTIC
ncbi:MAG: hypothetical protein J6Y82_08705 [Bacteroidales bacterium]|nr:hypothetical protein [Bacteroidales bacterium]